VDFYVVYIKEIHPENGWQVLANERDGVLVASHESMEERIEVGQTCMLAMALELPALVDEMDDAVATAYGAMPERLFLVGADGLIAYKGDLGPMGFDPEGWERAIEAAAQA
jgi:hypothetical protein